MGWYQTKFTDKDELIADLVKPQNTLDYDQEVFFWKLVGSQLWQIVRLHLKADNVIKGKLAGHRHTFIRLVNIKRGSEFYSIETLHEGETPRYYSCPLFFFEFDLDHINPEWREMVRQFQKNLTT